MEKKKKKKKWTPQSVLVLWTPLWALQSQVHLTKLSSRQDDDQRVLAGGLFLALKMRRMLHFGTTRHRQTAASRYPKPHEWLMSVLSDFTLFIQSVHSGLLVCILPVAVMRSPDSRKKKKKNDEIHPFQQLLKRWDLGWERGKKMKSERQLRFLMLSVSHSVGEHTLQTQVCWSPLNISKEGRWAPIFAKKRWWNFCCCSSRVCLKPKTKKSSVFVLRILQSWHASSHTSHLL